MTSFANILYFIHVHDTDAYSLEDWDGIDRHHFNAVVSDQDFADTYFPVFEVRYSHRW